MLIDTYLFYKLFLACYSTHMLLSFIGFFGTVSALIGLLSVVIYKVFSHVYGGNYAQYIYILKGLLIIMPAIMIISMSIATRQYSFVNKLFYVTAATWMALFVYLFLLAVIFGVLTALFPQSSFAPYLTISICASILAIGYGVWNASQPVVKHVTMHIPELAPDWQGKNIVLISDTHLGIVRSESFMKKVVNKINSANPDAVFIAGDLIDGPRFDYVRGLSPLADIVAPLGIFYTPGNHEAYNTEEAVFYAALPKNVTLLRDQKITINNTEIIGIDFANESLENTTARLLYTKYNPQMPTIAMLHDPKNMRALSDKSINLVFSGHTHGGQFFPNTLVVRSLYKKYTKGITQTDKTWSYTTIGVGTALSPVRIGTTPEIVVLHIEP